MENWYQRLLLAGLSCLPLVAQAEVGPPRQVVNPEVERRELKDVDIDTEDFEVSLYSGILSIQDFESDVVLGVRAAWHLTEDFFVEAAYGQSEGDETSYEKLSGGSPLFAGDERDYTFYNLSLGWNALPGEIFINSKYAFKSDLYLVLGAGSTGFLDDNWFTVTAGAGYRLLLTDWLAWRLDVRDHIFDRDTFGEDETTHNLELSTALTVFF